MSHQLIPRIVFTAVFVWAMLEASRDDLTRGERAATYIISTIGICLLAWGGFLRMNNNEDQSAFPIQDIDYSGVLDAQPWLTKREFVAAMLLQGICSSAAYAEDGFDSNSELALNQADSLFMKLKEQSDG